LLCKYRPVLSSERVLYMKKKVIVPLRNLKSGHQIELTETVAPRVIKGNEKGTKYLGV
jgi:hypothetical protein